MDDFRAGIIASREHLCRWFLGLLLLVFCSSAQKGKSYFLLFEDTSLSRFESGNQNSRLSLFHVRRSLATAANRFYLLLQCNTEGQIVINTLYHRKLLCRIEMVEMRCFSRFSKARYFDIEYFVFVMACSDPLQQSLIEVFCFVSCSK